MPATSASLIARNILGSLGIDIIGIITPFRDHAATRLESSLYLEFFGLHILRRVNVRPCVRRLGAAREFVDFMRCQ